MNREEQQPALSIPETPEELASFARDYFATDFPNPERKDCPRQAEIEKSVRLRQLPDDTLRRHLLACSECFTVYQKLREAYCEPPLVPLRQRLTEFWRRRRVLVLAPTLTALLVVVSVGLYLRITSRENGSIPEQHSISISVDSSPTVTPRSAPDFVEEPSVQEPAVNVAHVDLRDYTLRRGAGEPQDPPLHVSRRQTLFAVTLPEGSPSGAYTVSLLDAFGKTVRSRGAQSSDGKRLTATLNLQHLGNQRFRFCVARKDEPPSCYPILITESK